MRALSAVTDTDSDSTVMECTRVSSASSVSDGNRMNSLNGPGGTAGGAGRAQVGRFFDLDADVILSRRANSTQ